MTPDPILSVSQTLIIILSLAFFLVALLYSSVGLGGGSTYTALMTIAGIHYVLIPGISLTLNLLVTFIGMINFGRNGYIRLRIVVPFLVTSIPMAYVGGALELSQITFLWVLLFTLILVVIRIYFLGNLTVRITLTGWQSLVVSLLLGVLLGFIAGAVGIGGGIYLVPLLIMLSIANEKEAAAAGAVFIWLNSVAGLIARTQRGAVDFETILPMVLAVLAGGYIGSYFGSFKFKPVIIQRTLGVVIVIAIFIIGQRLI